MRKGDEEEAVNTGTLARTSVHDQCDAILGGVIFDVVVIGLVRSSDPPSHRSSARRHVYEVSVRCQSHQHPIVVAGLHDIRVPVAIWGSSVSSPRCCIDAELQGERVGHTHASRTAFDAALMRVLQLTPLATSIGIAPHEILRTS